MYTQKKGKLIVIEGIDGSGKTTQYNLLVKHLEKEGRIIRHIHFPRHNTPFFGKMVDQYLFGKFGNPAEINPHLASLLYACDRWEIKETLQGWLKQGHDIVLDRYATSNAGHQLGKIHGDVKKERYLKWLDEMEYRIFQIPRPDIVIYLHMPVKKVFQLMRNRNEKDLHESNFEHLKRAQDAYQFTVNKYSYWKKINCVQDKKILSIKIIHEKIWNTVLEIFKS